MKSRGARNGSRAGKKSGGNGNGNVPPRTRLLTVAQLAERWQLSERSIRRRIKDGEIEVVRIGRAVRIPE
jgi:excisionase family DNA binding protein